MGDGLLTVRADEAEDGLQSLTVRAYKAEDGLSILGPDARYPPPDSRWQRTACLDGRPVAAGGITLQWPDTGPDGYTGLAWFLCAEDLSTRDKVRVLLRLRSVYYAWRHEFSTIEMNCLRRGAGHRLARLCGMHWIGIRRKWLFGEDVTLYAWSKP